MVELRNLTLTDALAVVGSMRDRDRDCVRAILGDVDDEAFAVDRWRATGPAWAVVDDGRSVAICGLTLHTDWLAVAWLVATPGMRPQSWRKAARIGRTVLGRATDPTFEQYRHRVEAHVLSDWPEAQRFAQAFGFVLEGTRRAAGSGGEDIQTWAITGPVNSRA